MTTDHSTVVPQPLNPRDAQTLIQHRSPGDRVRTTMTDHLQTIHTVAKTTPPPRQSPLFILAAPPTPTTTQHAYYHYTPTQFQSDCTPVVVVEYPYTPSNLFTYCIGTLTTIARLPVLSSLPEADRQRPHPEVMVNG